MMLAHIGISLTKHSTRVNGTDIVFWSDKGRNDDCETLMIKRGRRKIGGLCCYDNHVHTQTG